MLPSVCWSCFSRSRPRHPRNRRTREHCCFFIRLRGCTRHIAHHLRDIYKLRVVARTREGFAWFFHIRRSSSCVRCLCWTPPLALAPFSSASIGPDVPIIRSFPVG